MGVIKTDIEGVLILEPDVFGDSRGWFCETYTKCKYEGFGITNEFIVRVVAGSVFDVAVDIRKGSPTYLKWVGVELSAENKKQFYIPRGFAHAFLTLEDNTEFVYKVDNYYSKECDRSIQFSDPSIGIKWPTDSPVLSDKDSNAPLLKDSDCNFIYDEMKVSN